MLKIGEFSKLSRISVRMLRHYAEIGLLEPKNTDQLTNYRYYGEDQLPVAEQITALKQMGFHLATIGEILKNYDDPKALSNFLFIQLALLQTQAAQVDEQLRLLRTMMERLRKDGTSMNYNVTLKQLPERSVASVRQVIPSYDQEGILWDILMKETAPLNIQDADPCYTMAIFYDGEFKEHQVDVEVQKCIKGIYQNTEHVVFKTEPAILIASAIYQGSYEKVSEVNEAVANWVRDNGYEFDGLSFNIYHVSPHETQNPEEYVTEVCYPVRKKQS